ncbi:hypothetical protein NQD34_006080 [Periophthalmus magnuspinnatus]|nr:hypothetical protein NQD34_006080 [Periophthalmus magnuspinnatus]
MWTQQRTCPHHRHSRWRQRRQRTGAKRRLKTGDRQRMNRAPHLSKNVWRLLEAFPLTQEEQELVCNSGTHSTALPPAPAESTTTYMEQQWQDFLDLMEPENPGVDMVGFLEQMSQVTPSAAQGGPLMDGYLQHDAHSEQELLPLLPSDQLDDPTPAPLPSSLSSSLLPVHGPSLLLGEEDLDGDLDGDLEELLEGAQILEEMSLLDLALEEGFGEELSEKLEEHGYLDPELTRRPSQLSPDRSRETSGDMEDIHTIQPDDEEELDSDSGLSLDSSHSPASPSQSEASSYSSSSSTSRPSPMELQVAVKEEPLDEEELGAVVGHYHPQHDSKHVFSSPFHPDQKLFDGFPWQEQISHDHTYNQPSRLSPKISSKHLKSSPKHDKPYQLPKHLWSRDERRAKALKIPFSNDVIINLPVEEFNDLLANYDLSEEQLNLVRDIRRRGKNKIAAQNCRKRKMDNLQGLEKDVTMLRRRKSRLLKDKQEALRTLQELKQRLSSLYQDVFSSLRDGEGRPLDVHEYMLSFESDGTVDVVSRRQGRKEKSRRKQKDK